MNSLPAWIAGHLSAERRREALSGTLLFLAAAAVHSRGLANGFIWDDNSYVTLNPLVTGEARLADIWLKPEASPQYYPLLFTFLRIQYALWGPWPAGFHLVSILLHAASAVVLWRILKRLEAPGAWAAALLFGIHPVQVETVAWITEQKNVFSGFFYFLSFLFGLRAFTPPGEGRGGKIAFRPCYGAALAFFVLALLCKTVTATLPVSLLAVWWWKRGRPTRALLIGLAPFLALASSGETDAAAAHWREALRLRPDFREARENLERLAAGRGR